MNSTVLCSRSSRVWVDELVNRVSVSHENGDVSVAAFFSFSSNPVVKAQCSHQQWRTRIMAFYRMS